MNQPLLKSVIINYRRADRSGSNRKHYDTPPVSLL
jgi:hypothetical protein